MHQGDHTQLEVFPSEMRCRGVVLLASRISVPSPATPCTTPVKTGVKGVFPPTRRFFTNVPGSPHTR